MARFRTATIIAGAVAALVFTTPTNVSAQSTVGLESFGVLGSTTVTNVGNSVIDGNVGVAPSGAVTGFFPPGIVNAPYSIHVNDQVAIDARAELTAAYLSLAALPPTVVMSGPEMGGLTLTPGVYFFSSAALLNGQLTLDGQGNPNALFVFNITSDLTTGSGSSILLINQAQGGRVFFRVGSSATLDTTTAFQGTIMALTSISLNDAASIDCGAALARNGEVTLINNSIQVCAFAAATFAAVLGPTATANQLAIAAAFDAFVLAGGVLPPAFQALLDFLSRADLAAAFDQLSGEVATGAAPAGFQSMNSFLSLLNPFLDEDEGGLDEDTVRALGYAGEDSQPSGAIRTELGAKFHRSIALHDGATLALRARAAWAHDFGSRPNVVAEFQAMPGAPFAVQGAAPGRDSLLLMAGAEARFVNGFAVAGTFDSEFAVGSQTYAGTGRVSYRW